MIGRAWRRTATGLLLVLLALLGGSGSASPAIDASQRRAALHAVALAADAALADIEARLRDAVDAGRRGAALVLEGSEDPAPHLQAAAAAARETAPLAMAARAEMRRLTGTAAAVAPEIAAPEGGPTADELLGIAGQLDDASLLAGLFVERRVAAAVVLRELQRALAALDRDDPRAALERIAAAEEAHGTVAAWVQPPAVLPVWLDTTGVLLDATRRMAVATQAGDLAAAERASRDYAAGAERAHTADVALGVAMAEAGSAVTGVPMRRLAEALAAVERQRAATASVLEATRRQ